jgi:DNA-binding transcriptional LysR family regulator
MPRLVQWEQQIGRRLRLRDLSVFFTVVEYGSMAKAASKLGVSTPSISEVIAGLEHALGVRLLDRTPKGVTTTLYGDALLSRGRAAFDELRLGIRDIEFIADPGSGELRIGCPESIAAGFLLPVMERAIRDYPRVKFHVEQVRQPTVEFPELHERKVDLVLARLVKEPQQGRLDDELNADVLFDDPFSLAVGSSSKWARRRNIDLADLVDEPWIMPPLDAVGAYHLAEAYTLRGEKMPNFVLTTFSLHLRIDLVSSGQFITALPRSTLQIVAKRRSLIELPIRLSLQPTPVAIVTLRNRTLGPAADAFIRCTREVAKSVASRPRLGKR